MQLVGRMPRTSAVLRRLMKPYDARPAARERESAAVEAAALAHEEAELTRISTLEWPAQDEPAPAPSPSVHRPASSTRASVSVPLLAVLVHRLPYKKRKFGQAEVLLEVEWNIERSTRPCPGTPAFKALPAERRKRIVKALARDRARARKRAKKETGQEQDEHQLGAGAEPHGLAPPAIDDGVVVELRRELDEVHKGLVLKEEQRVHMERLLQAERKCKPTQAEFASKQTESDWMAQLAIAEARRSKAKLKALAAAHTETLAMQVAAAEQQGALGAAAEVLALEDQLKSKAAVHMAVVASLKAQLVIARTATSAAARAGAGAVEAGSGGEEEHIGVDTFGLDDPFLRSVVECTKTEEWQPATIRIPVGGAIRAFKDNMSSKSRGKVPSKIHAFALITRSVHEQSVKSWKDAAKFPGSGFSAADVKSRTPYGKFCRNTISEVWPCCPPIEFRGTTCSAKDHVSVALSNIPLEVREYMRLSLRPAK